MIAQSWAGGNATSEPIKPYTVAEGMKAGWCWRIDHEDRHQSRLRLFKRLYLRRRGGARVQVKNPKIHTTRTVKFISGRYERAWVKNVVAVGNSCGFVEPLEATSLACDLR